VVTERIAEHQDLGVDHFILSGQTHPLVVRPLFL
jgi:hypothetical protein